MGVVWEDPTLWTTEVLIAHWIAPDGLKPVFDRDMRHIGYVVSPPLPINFKAMVRAELETREALP